MSNNALIPEFAVRDCQKSLAFYRDLLGFAVEYERPEEGFAFLSIGNAQLMLDQISLGRTFGDDLGSAKLGLGLNVQICVSQDVLSEMLSKLATAHYPLYLPPEEKWYRKGAQEVGQRQFVVADPDGYLLRFAVNLGARDI